MKSARTLAVQALTKADVDDAYSTLSLSSVLRQSPDLTTADKALVTALVYGVTQRRLTLDHTLSLYLPKPLQKLHPTVLSALRVGAYQILFMDKIPASAAVNESVKTVKTSGCAYAAGLVNAVLRKVAANGLVLPPETDTLRRLSAEYSCPTELTQKYIDWFKTETAEEILRVSLLPRPVFLRVNTCRTTAADLQAQLSGEGADASICALDGALRLDRPGDLTRTKAYAQGLFHVQDLSSQQTVKLLDLTPGQTFTDLCAAPGGKTFTAAEYLQNEGKVLSFDVYPHKCKLIEDGARRLGLSVVTPVLSDARAAASHISEADAVLCDVPCSGLGVIGRKPEIKYKDLAALSELPPLQYEILCAGAGIVKPGGTLVYSTCTLNPAENGDVCDRFLREHPDFTLADDEGYRGVCTGSYMTVIPSENGGDGFFAAKFKRKQA